MVTMRRQIYRFEGELDEATISEFIQDHEFNVRPRLRKLYNYYLGDHDILRRPYKIDSPQGRLVHNFPNYITTQSTAYFMGVPISYTSDNDKALDIIQPILDFNDEADMNATHAENMSIYGVSYELQYINKKNRIDTRFAVISPEEIIIVYDNELEPNIVAAIRYYRDEINSLKVELYDAEKITYFTGDAYHLRMDSSVDHFFKDVPVSVFINNNSAQGDFETVLSLIDEYNQLNSDTANDFEYFSDAYLFLSGATIDNEEALNMKENKIINIDDPNAKAQFLTKNIQDAALENYKNRLVNDIHKFSAVPNMTDEAFAGNLSGVAIKYKILGLENQASMKERKFKKGLQRRYELLFNLLYTRGILSSEDYLTIEPRFKRSLPPNVLEEADMAGKLQGIVSAETILSNLSFVEDVTKELQQLQDESNNIVTGVEGEETIAAIEE